MCCIKMYEEYKVNMDTLYKIKMRFFSDQSKMQRNYLKKNFILRNKRIGRP